MQRENQTWQSVRDEVERRIQTRLWPVGAALPKEEDLAAELGCARVTVNRALRDLADRGILTRKRKSGTRVAEFPTRNVRLSVPVLRKEIEAQGSTYGYALLAQKEAPPPAPIRAALQVGDAPALHLQSLHLANGRPFAFEDRWINLQTVPEAQSVDFERLSANEWLVGHAPLTRGEMSFGATSLDGTMAKTLGAQVGESALTSERRTWNDTQPVTHVTLIYAPGHRIETSF